MSKSLSFLSAYFCWLGIFIKGLRLFGFFFFWVLSKCLLPVFWGHSRSVVKKQETWKPRTALKHSKWPNNSPASSTTSQNPLGVPKEEWEQGKNVFTPFHSSFYRFPLRKSKIQIPLKWLSQNAAAWHPCHTLILLWLTTLTAMITCIEDFQQLVFRRSNFISFSYFVKNRKQLQQTETTNAAQRGCTHCSQLCSTLWPASGRLSVIPACFRDHKQQKMQLAHPFSKKDTKEEQKKSPKESLAKEAACCLLQPSP